MNNGNVLKGFGNYFQSEALDGALPLTQNSPQNVPHKLYAEQINGSAFTCPRQNNHSIWTYRIQPSVVHNEYSLYKTDALFTLEHPARPNQLRYTSLFNNDKKTLSFSDGLQPIAANKVARILTYQVNQTNSQQFFVNHDGEYLIVAQQGTVTLATELGTLTISPGSIAVIPRGIIFQALGNDCYGYICESLAGRFRLPDLGPIGANGLANPNDFVHPNAHYIDKQAVCQVISLYQNHLWQKELTFNPLNVVAWKGNYLPYMYDLTRFNTINSVSFDHPDPSIFTVLTVPSLVVGAANIDFVLFPERWVVAEHTFRPPYFHRNCMSEFMGLIYGNYDAKDKGFMPGGFSIHNAMTAHGPDSQTYNDAISKPLKNTRYENTLAFMFESVKAWDLTQPLTDSDKKDISYLNCWQDLTNNFHR